MTTKRNITRYVHVYTLHYNTLHYSTLQYMTVHCSTLHHITYVHKYVYQYITYQMVQYQSQVGYRKGWRSEDGRDRAMAIPCIAIVFSDIHYHMGVSKNGGYLVIIHF